MTLVSIHKSWLAKSDDCGDGDCGLHCDGDWLPDEGAVVGSHQLVPGTSFTCHETPEPRWTAQTSKARG